MIWIRILLYILYLIARGISKQEAVSIASRDFGVSESEIWKRGGF